MIIFRLRKEPQANINLWIKLENINKEITRESHLLSIENELMFQNLILRIST